MRVCVYDTVCASDFCLFCHTFGRFNSPLPYKTPNELELLSEEFTYYRLLPDTCIPKEVLEKATVLIEDGAKKYRMHAIWNFLASLESADSTPQFPRLSEVAKLVLTIPHSNAQEERVFSMIRKNKTAFRPSLDTVNPFPGAAEYIRLAIVRYFKNT